MKIDPKYRPDLCASTDETRFNIMEPYFDPASKQVIATDGHMLVAVPVKVEKGDAAGYVAPRAGEALAPALRDLRRAQDAAWDDFAMALADPGAAAVITPADKVRAFPKWRDVIPAFKEGDPGTASVALSAVYLAKIAEALGAHNAQVVLTFRVRDGEGEAAADAILVRPRAQAFDDTTDEREGFGVLMPVRFVRRQPAANGKAPKKAVQPEPSPSPVPATDAPRPGDT